MRRLLVAVGFVLAFASPAWAKSTITLDQPNPSFGDSVTFSFSQDRTEFPWIQNVCEQDGRVVYEEWRGMYDGYPSPGPFVLGPTVSWADDPETGFAADCEARLIMFGHGGNPQTLARVGYAVAG